MRRVVCGLLQLLACALDSVFEVLDCADDVFALGSTSSIVATELASLSWAKTRRKVLQFCHFIYCWRHCRLMISTLLSLSRCFLAVTVCCKKGKGGPCPKLSLGVVLISLTWALSL